LTLTQQEEREYRALELIYDDQAAWTMLSTLTDLLGDDQARHTIVALKNRGLIAQNGQTYPGYCITAVGQVAVEEMRARRADRGYRRAACREAFLRWVDSCTKADDAGSRVAREHFSEAADLVAFTDDESCAAADFLVAAGLIKSISAMQAKHILVWVTERGQEAVDAGGAEAFLNNERQVGSVNHFTVTGDGNNVAATVGDGNTITQTTNDFDLAKAVKFAAAVRQALPVLGLPESAVDALKDIEQEKDVERAKRGTALLHRLVTATTTGALGQIVGMLGAAALGISS
jgi:hypothetical protein